jgi:hypothetical protein
MAIILPIMLVPKASKVRGITYINEVSITEQEDKR